MTDANIPALLEELREVDLETYVCFLRLKSASRGEIQDIEAMELIDHDIIQGCIQRAIAEKGWSYQQILYQNPTIYEAYLIGHRETIRRANTPAAAILAAYIEAVRATR